MTLKISKLFIFMVILSVSVVQAQINSCPELVEQALEQVEDTCTEIKRNEACYGNGSLEAELATAADVNFETEGDIAGLQFIQSLTLSGLDVEESIWGISLIKLQANLPDTAPGQNVSFVIFGDVTLENETFKDEEAGIKPADTDYSAPMQAFYFTSGIGELACNEAPQSGLLLQTPEGSAEVMFRANGVDILLGSTVYLQAQLGGEMIISVIEGQAIIFADDVGKAVAEGNRIRYPLDEDGNVSGPASKREPYNLDEMNVLPLNLLEREIEVAAPMGISASTPSSGNTEADNSDVTIAPTDETNAETASSIGLQVSVDGGTSLSTCSGQAGDVVQTDDLFNITINNQSSRGVTLHWVDWECSRQEWKTIDAGTSGSQGTYNTHPWILTDTETGETIFGPWGSLAPEGFTITVTDQEE